MLFFGYVIHNSILKVFFYTGVRKPTGPQPSWPATGGGDALGVVPPPYWYEPSLTSIQLRQANAQELKKNDAYWENRIRNLEANHKKMQEIMDLEYKKAVSILACCYIH